MKAARLFLPNPRMDIRSSRSALCGRRRRSMILIAAWLVFLLLFKTGPAVALDAPGAPGLPSVWAPAAKELLGTSAGSTSRVYFTGAEGILTEVFYPTLDTVQNVDLQLLVTDASRTWGDEERRQRDHKVSLVNKHALVWQVVTTADSGKWRITKKIFSDPGRNSVIQRVTFEAIGPGGKIGDFNLYLLNNPAINNSGGGSDYPKGADNSRTLTGGGRTLLVASEPGSTSSALAVSLPWKVADGQAMVSSGFVGQNDGYTDLLGGARDRTMDWHFDGAYGGNVAQMGWIDPGSPGSSKISFDVVLAFGSSEREAMEAANGTLDSDLAAVEKAYTKEWLAYTSGLDSQNGLADDQYYMAAMSLKSVQDKSNGAMIAGAGTPWGENAGDVDGEGNLRRGYHLVWARDLFKFASALIAAGDLTSANKAVEYLFNVQMQTATSEGPYSRPGRFPQNTTIDGRPYWNGTQMDETAMPIILAWKLNRKDLWPRIKMAAEYLAGNGPATGQERWEEMAGYSPSTIAAEIAGLVCAASLAEGAGDSGAAAFYLAKADEWRNNIAAWTFTTRGFHGNGRYYVRINANREPDDDITLKFGNNTGSHGERYIIDGGFLELVRMGVLSPNDWSILETLPEYDSILKQTIPGKGDAWFRYNYDGYGEYNDGSAYNGGGCGRLWPIFTAERGIYEIARSGNSAKGKPYLQALKGFSSRAGLIPEQVWNVSASVTGRQVNTPPGCIPGAATRSMQPLSWAMGEYINLIAAMNKGRSDAPSAVCSRYSCNAPQTEVTFKVKAETGWGEHIVLVGSTPLLGRWLPGSGVRLSAAAYPVWTATVSLPASSSFKYKFVKVDGGGAAVWESGEDRVLSTAAGGAMSRDEAFR